MKQMKRMMAVLWVVAVAGAAAFIYGAAGPLAPRAWQAFLVNLIFWIGVAQGGVTFCAVLHVTESKWGDPFVFVARPFSGFLPVSFVLFLVLYAGRNELFPWIAHPVPGREAWLSFPFLYARDGIALLLFLWAGWWWVRSSIAQKQRHLDYLSPAVILLFAGVSTLLSWDLIMSLDRRWFSTLLGGYYFIGAFYGAIAFIAVLSAVVRAAARMGSWMTRDKFHDLGTLLFAFCLLWMAMFWAQYLTIWYGNLPDESAFVYLRIWDRPWIYLSGAVFALGWFIPFVVLLDREVKKNPRSLSLVALMALAGLWLERYLFVVPSLSATTLPLGWIEAVISLGFFAAFILSWNRTLWRQFQSPS